MRHTGERQLKGHTKSDYDRNVVALGKMEHQTAELFEPAGRVFGCRGMSLKATVTGHSERLDAPSTAAPFSNSWIPACVP